MKMQKSVVMNTNSEQEEVLQHTFLKTLAAKDQRGMINLLRCLDSEGMRIVDLAKCVTQVQGRGVPLAPSINWQEGGSLQQKPKQDGVPPLPTIDWSK
jgi:hypothetical protein